MTLAPLLVIAVGAAAGVAVVLGKALSESVRAFGIRALLIGLAVGLVGCRGRALAARRPAAARVTVDPLAREGFSRTAEQYERARPTYAAEAVRWIADEAGLGPGTTVVDLGAGTGKLTRLLVEHGRAGGRGRAARRDARRARRASCRRSRRSARRRTRCRSRTARPVRSRPRRPTTGSAPMRRARSAGCSSRTACSRCVWNERDGDDPLSAALEERSAARAFRSGSTASPRDWQHAASTTRSSSDRYGSAASRTAWTRRSRRRSRRSATSARWTRRRGARSWRRCAGCAPTSASTRHDRRRSRT